MTRDEIVALARLADVPEYDDDDCEDGVRFEAGISALERFAAVVAAAEREAIIKDLQPPLRHPKNDVELMTDEIARALCEAIRARPT